MSETRFRLSMIGIIAMLCLSASPGIGAIIGLFFGFGIAFFIAGPSFMVAGMLRSGGIPLNDKDVAAILVMLYVLMVIGLAYAAWRAWANGASDRARLFCAKAILFSALPFMGWLSIAALADAWP